MICLPAGYSDDEDIDFEHFSFNDEIKTQKEKFEEDQIDVWKQRKEIENSPSNRLYNAIITENINAVIEILDKGCDINGYLNDNWTALYLAASQANLEIITLLLERGADINTHRDYLTLLMAVCSVKKNGTNSNTVVAIISKLIEYGIDVLAIDRKRRTAFMFACQQGFDDVVNILIPLSDIHATDNQGWTALFYAVNENNPGIVKLLLDIGLNPDIEDLRFSTVKYHAKINDFQDILKLLPKDYDEYIPSNNNLNENYFEDFFNTLEKPLYYRDIEHLLYGMSTTHLIPLFEKKNIDLESLLTATDEYLKEIGIIFSGHRKKVLKGLHRFHNHPWKLTSLPIFEKNKFYTTVDLLEMMGNMVKHMIILRCTINFLNNQRNLYECKEVEPMQKSLNSCMNRLQKIKKTLAILRIQVLKYEKQYPADYIGKDVVKKSSFTFINGFLFAIPLIFIGCYLMR